MNLLQDLWKRLGTGAGRDRPGPARPFLRVQPSSAGREAVFVLPAGGVGGVEVRSGPATHGIAVPDWSSLGLSDLNLVEGRRWAARGGGRRTRSGVNFAQAWTLADSDTAYLRTQGGEGSVDLQLDTAGIRLAPGSDARFSVLAGAHRCRAALMVEVLDAGGATLAQFQASVSTSARGGRERAGYHQVELTWTTPPGGVGLRVALRKGPGPSDADSFLFAAEPVLAPEGEAVRTLAGWPVDEVAALRAGLAAAGRLWRADLPAPAAPGEEVALVLDGQTVATAALQSVPVRQGGRLEVPSPIAAGEWNARDTAVGRRIAAHRAWLQRAARNESIPDLARLEARVDGADGATSISFAAPEDPAAAVLLHAGSDADRLVRSLAALQLAANTARFSLVVLAEPAFAQALQGRAPGLVVRDPGALAAGDEDPRLSGLPIVLLDAGLEPVAGWLDELLATAANFADVSAVGGKVIGADGRVEQAGALDGEPSRSPHWLGVGDSPRNPAVGFVRPVDLATPLLVQAADWPAVRPHVAAWDPAAVCGALRGHGRRILYAPTAEFWRLPDADDRTRLARWAPVAGPVDRPELPRVLFIDQEFPTPDMDAGGYASFQEMRLLQAAGCQVDFLPKNLAWMDRHAIALGRAGVRSFYAPFARDFDGFLREAAGSYDALFVVRYKVMRLVQEALDGVERRPRLILNLADLHFLREQREAAAGTPGYSAESAAETQAAELRAIAGADLTLTYSPVEAEVIRSHTHADVPVGLAPWTVETWATPIGGRWSDTAGLLFLGGFGHPPNAQAAKAFVADVMPRLRAAGLDAGLRIVGSKPTAEVLSLAAPDVEVLGYVADLDEVFRRARVFVAPLLAGAGLKGKVVEAMARGVPCVLTSVAAEATGLAHGVDCLIADGPQAQAEAIARLYQDEALWTAIAHRVLETARDRFGFDHGVELMRSALDTVGVRPPPGPHLHYLRPRPDRAAGASAAPAVLRLP